MDFIADQMGQADIHIARDGIFDGVDIGIAMWSHPDSGYLMSTRSQMAL